MARAIQAYTLDVQTILLIERLVESFQSDQVPGKLLPYLAELPSAKRTVAPPDLDEHDLAERDYTDLYPSIPLQKPLKFGKRVVQPVEPPRLPDWETFTQLVQSRADSPTRASIFAEVKRRQLFNRQARRHYVRLQAKHSVSKPAARTGVNASRVVEALILLGLHTVNEGVHGTNVEGSSRENVGQGQDKLPNPYRRKALTV